ncbi:unnamed protein product [Didymodactylos carnosus]|uniref:Uncharacterized protein n=1 Tax=Didymodactylos carnosus TaxID=1234261 RepID=A0A8S2ZYH4_9BILA|nr:unnamed protein product [Didymodactylos carnosus]
MSVPGAVTLMLLSPSDVSVGGSVSEVEMADCDGGILVFSSIDVSVPGTVTVVLLSEPDVSVGCSVSEVEMANCDGEIFVSSSVDV